MTCSNVSIAFTRTTGVEDFSVVDFAGRGRFNPQSPLARDDAGASMAARMGYGSVAVSDSNTIFEVAGSWGGDNAGGSVNKRDFRSRLAVGDTLMVAIIAPEAGLSMIGKKVQIEAVPIKFIP